MKTLLFVVLLLWLPSVYAEPKFTAAITSNETNLELNGTKNLRAQHLRNWFIPIQSAYCPGNCPTTNSNTIKNDSSTESALRFSVGDTAGSNSRWDVNLTVFNKTKSSVRTEFQSITTSGTSNASTNYALEAIPTVIDARYTIYPTDERAGASFSIGAAYWKLNSVERSNSIQCSGPDCGLITPSLQGNPKSDETSGYGLIIGFGFEGPPSKHSKYGIDISTLFSNDSTFSVSLSTSLFWRKSF